MHSDSTLWVLSTLWNADGILQNGLFGHLKFIILPVSTALPGCAEVNAMSTSLPVDRPWVSSPQALG